MSSCHVIFLRENVPFQATNWSIVYCEHKKCHDILTIFKLDLFQAWKTQLHLISTFHLLENNQNQLSYFNSDFSQFKALYPYTHNAGNICISQLYDHFINCPRIIFFLPKAYATNQLWNQKLFKILVGSLPQFASHYLTKLPVLLTGLC